MKKVIFNFCFLSLRYFFSFLLCRLTTLHAVLIHISFYASTRFLSERDNYIEINWSNVAPDARSNFEQFKSHVSMFSTPYDYDSIMHYGTKAFAVNKSIPTIIAKQSARNMGQRKGKSLEKENSHLDKYSKTYSC